MWFEKNPKKTWLLFIALLILILEVILRVIDPPIFGFAQSLSSLIKADREKLVDLVPNARVHFLNQRPYLNFLVSVNENGFRTYDRPIDYYPGPDVNSISGGPSKFIHCIGDSLTMGWGLEYSSSYPAILETLLPPEYRVLNLGVPGFGAIGATLKSKSIWGGFPPKVIVYLFCPNDPDDDRKCLSRSYPYHLLVKLQKSISIYSYTASVPQAIKYYAYFGWGQHDDVTPDPTNHGFRISDGIPPAELKVFAPPINLSNEISPDQKKALENTVNRLAAFRDEARKNNVTLIALAMDNPIGRQFGALAKEKDVDVTLYKLPPHAYLRNEGHFSQYGNWLLAHLVLDLMEGQGLIDAAANQ